MTRHEADANKGKEVLDTTTGETGVLREHRKVSGGFGHNYYVGVIDFPGGVKRSVWLKKLKLSATKAPAVKSTPQTKTADYEEVLHGLRSCCLATSQASHKQTATASTREESSFAGLFKKLFGRKPTAAEIEYMMGGLGLGPCDKCKSSRYPAFKPDGSYEPACICTEAVAAVNEFVKEKIKK